MNTFDRDDLFKVRWRGFYFVALFQVVLLAVLVPNNQEHINVDPICYIRIAQYYHSGHWDLAISSYWSPMTSWLLVPFLSIIDEPLAASPIVTAIMAIVFLWGSAALIQAMGLSKPYGLAAAFICSVASAQWAATGLGGDVLMGGLCSAAIAMMVGPRWTTNVRTPLLAGALFGAAYLTKSIALPWCILVGAAFALMHALCGVTWSAAVRSYLVTTTVALAISAPWIALISANAGTFTIGTSSLGAHAYAAPENFNKEHVANKRIDVLRVPEPGRLTQWEDPEPESFLRWNPLASLANLKHQLYVIVRNFMTVVDVLSEMDGLHLGLAATIFAFLIHSPWRINMANERWRWALLPVATLSAPYLPVFAELHRYFYAVFPCLVIATLGLSGALAATARGNVRTVHRLALVLVVASFLFPYVWRLGALIPGRVENTSAPRDLARRLRETDHDGPVAAPHIYSVEALYVAYFLGQPMYEYDLDSHDLERLTASGAYFVVAPRESPVFDQLLRDPCFESLDRKLYHDERDAARNPIAAFAIRPECQSKADARPNP